MSPLIPPIQLRVSSSAPAARVTIRNDDSATLLIGFVLPEAAWSWLAHVEFVFEILLMYSMLCAPPLVTLLAPPSRLPGTAKWRLIIATWVLGIGLPFALRSTVM